MGGIQEERRWPVLFCIYIYPKNGEMGVCGGALRRHKPRSPEFSDRL